MNEKKSNRYLVLILAVYLPNSASGNAAGGADNAGIADIVIRGGTVVTMDPGRRILEGGAVVVRGETIEADEAPSRPLISCARLPPE